MYESRAALIREQLRQRINRLVFNLMDGLIWILVRIGLRHRDLPPAGSGYRAEKNIPYQGPRSHPRQRLDIYTPNAPEPMPILIYIHGGGFSQCSRDTHVSAPVMAARAGYLVFHVDYRRAPEEPYPSAPIDVCAAYCWIVENAHRYGGDPGNLHVAGESAGGNLVATLLIACCWKRPEPWLRRVYDLQVVPTTVHPLCGFHQVSEPSRYAHLVRRRPYLGGMTLWIMEQFARNYLPENWREANNENLLADPARFFEAQLPPDRPTPPILLSVGLGDVIARETDRLHNAFQDLGLDVTALHYRGEPHGFQLMLNRAAARLFWKEMIGWMHEREAPSDSAQAA